MRQQTKYKHQSVSLVFHMPRLHRQQVSSFKICQAHHQGKVLMLQSILGTLSFPTLHLCLYLQIKITTLELPHSAGT